MLLGLDRLGYTVDAHRQPETDLVSGRLLYPVVVDEMGEAECHGEAAEVLEAAVGAGQVGAGLHDVPACIGQHVRSIPGRRTHLGIQGEVPQIGGEGHPGPLSGRIRVDHLIGHGAQQERHVGHCSTHRPGHGLPDPRITDHVVNDGAGGGAEAHDAVEGGWVA